MWRLFPKRWEVSNKCIPWNLRKYKCNSKPRCLEKRDYYGKNNKKYFRRNHNIRTEKSFWSDLCFNRIKVRGHKTYGFEYMDCSFLRFHKFLRPDFFDSFNQLSLILWGESFPAIKKELLDRNCREVLVFAWHCLTAILL